MRLRLVVVGLVLAGRVGAQTRVALPAEIRLSPPAAAEGTSVSMRQSIPAAASSSSPQTFIAPNLAADAPPAPANPVAGMPAQSPSSSNFVPSDGEFATFAPSPQHQTKADDDIRARNPSIPRLAQETANALAPEPGRSAVSGDLLSPEYAPFDQASFDRIKNSLLHLPEMDPHEYELKAVFNPDGEADRAAFRNLAEHAGTGPQALQSMLQGLYEALRIAYFMDQPSEARIGVSSRLHELTARFLDRLADNRRLPEAARNLAKKTRERFLGEDRLLSAFAWAHAEKTRIADARREVAQAASAREKRTLAADIGTSSENRLWAPPPPSARPPAPPGSGKDRVVTDLRIVRRKFKDRSTEFRLARSRWEAARRMPLGRGPSSRETRRWENALRSFSDFLDAYEHDAVDYVLNDSIRMGFLGWVPDDRPPTLPLSPGFKFQERPDEYLLTASFDTRIDDPAVLASVRRSIEGYWSGEFLENGEKKRFRTRVLIRALGPNQAYSPDTLRLMDGGSQSAAEEDRLILERRFPFFAAAHEFGHLLGLHDEYIDDYSPELMRKVFEADRSSLMAHPEGVVQPRHFARVVELLKQAEAIGDGIGDLGFTPWR